MEILCAYATFSDFQEAQKIANAVVAKKFAACANIFSPHTAIYQWGDKLNEHNEIAVLFKTTSDRVDDLIKEIKSMHSYTEPAISTWKVDGGSLSYLNWIVKQTNR